MSQFTKLMCFVLVLDIIGEVYFLVFGEPQRTRKTVAVDLVLTIAMLALGIYSMAKS